MNSHNQAKKQEYWQKRITAKLNSVMPQIARQLKEIVDMANHALPLEDRKKLRVIIAHNLGTPLSRLEPHAPTPESVQHPKAPVHAATADEHTTEAGVHVSDEQSGSSSDSRGTETNLGTKVREDGTDNQEHLRSSVLPHEGRSDREGDNQPSETIQSGS